MDDMVVGVDLGARRAIVGGKRGGAWQRALVSQWQAAGYLVVAAGILLALTLLRDAVASPPVAPVLALVLALLAPPVLAGILTRLRHPRLAAAGCYLGACSSVLLSFCAFCSAGLLLDLRYFGLALEYAVWAMLLGGAALSLARAVEALRCVPAQPR